MLIKIDDFWIDASDVSTVTSESICLKNGRTLSFTSPWDENQVDGNSILINSSIQQQSFGNDQA